MTESKLLIAKDLMDSIKKLDSEIEKLQDYLNRGNGFALSIDFNLYDKIGTGRQKVVLPVNRDSQFCKFFITEKLNLAIGERHNLQTKFDNF